MISLGISKPNSKTIRNPSANLWFSLPGTLGQSRWGPAGACVSSLPAPQGADSAWESAGRAHTRGHVSSPPRVHPPRVPEPRRHPPSFSAPCPGPGARRPLPCPQTRRDPRLWGSAQARGRCCHPRGAQPEQGGSRGSCFLLSPLKGRSEQGRGLCKGCWGCAWAPGGAARGCGGQISSVPGAVSQALCGAIR